MKEKSILRLTSQRDLFQQGINTKTFHDQVSFKSNPYLPLRFFGKGQDAGTA